MYSGCLVACDCWFCVFSSTFVYVLSSITNSTENWIESTQFIESLFLLPQSSLLFGFLFLFLLKLCLFFPSLLYSCYIAQKETIRCSIEWQLTNLLCTQMRKWTICTSHSTIRKSKASVVLITQFDGSLKLDVCVYVCVCFSINFITYFIFTVHISWDIIWNKNNEYSTYTVYYLKWCMCAVSWL